jgi:hypothetical protein
MNEIPELLNSLRVTHRDKLAADAVVQLLPKYCKRFDFDIVERAYAIADRTLKEIERAKK